jgi:hypothetical protein
MLPDPLHPIVVHFPVVLVVLLPVFALGALLVIRRGGASGLGATARGRRRAHPVRLGRDPDGRAGGGSCREDRRRGRASHARGSRRAIPGTLCRPAGRRWCRHGGRHGRLRRTDGRHGRVARPGPRRHPGRRHRRGPRLPARRRQRIPAGIARGAAGSRGRGTRRSAAACPRRRLTAGRSAIRPADRAPPGAPDPGAGCRVGPDRRGAPCLKAGRRTDPLSGWFVGPVRSSRSVRARPFGHSTTSDRSIDSGTTADVDPWYATRTRGGRNGRRSTRGRFRRGRRRARRSSGLRREEVGGSRRPAGSSASASG